MAISPVLAQALMQPQIPDIVGQFQKGRQEAEIEQRRAEEKRLKELTGQALAGDREVYREIAGLDPRFAMQLSEHIGARDEKALDNYIKSAGIIERQLTAGDAVGALGMLDQQIEIMRYNGMNTDAPMTIRRELAAGNTEEALGQVREFNEAIGQAKELTASQRDFEYYQQLRKTDPTRAQEFGRSKGYLAKPTRMERGELSAGLEKRLFDAQDKAVQSGEQAREMEVLANDYQRLSAAGTAATVTEFIKSVAGTQDEQTELRRRLSKIRLSEALKFLPPGPATDKDVAEAMKGVPKETASIEQVQSFLRGSAKIARLEEAFNTFKSNYISEKTTSQGLLKEWRRKLKAGEVEVLKDFAATGQQQQATPQGQQVGRFKIRVK